jgi:hypothetical protein
MADVRVRCTNKRTRGNHQSITHLGGPGWRWSRQQVVNSILSRTNTFYVDEGGRRVSVRVRRGLHGYFVQTWADGQWRNNLIALPECPH